MTNKAQFNKLLGNIRSLTDSTTLEVVDQKSGLRFKLGGRCSPYLSHQTIESDVFTHWPKEGDFRVELSNDNGRNLFIGNWRDWENCGDFTPQVPRYSEMTVVVYEPEYRLVEVRSEFHKMTISRAMLPQKLVNELETLGVKLPDVFSVYWETPLVKGYEPGEGKMRPTYHELERYLGPSTLAKLQLGEDDDEDDDGTD